MEMAIVSTKVTGRSARLATRVKRIVWRLSFKRHFGDVERYRVTIYRFQNGDLVSYYCKYGKAEFRSSTSLSDIKNKIYLHIRTEAGD